MEDMGKHPESLPTHGHNRFKGLNNDFAKIKMKKDINPLKILAQISAVDVKVKQSLRTEKKVEVVQRCTGDNYAQIIAVTEKVAGIESKQNTIALELCKVMKQVWHIKGHDDDDKGDNDINNNSVGLEILLGTVKDKQKLNQETKML
jgi:hypothetical protein